MKTTRWKQFLLLIAVALIPPAVFYFLFRPPANERPRFRAPAPIGNPPLQYTHSSLRPRIPLSGTWTFRLPGSEKKHRVTVPHVWNSMPGLEDYEGAAVYARQFSLPRSWPRRRVILCLDGVAWSADVTVNGRLVSAVADGRLPVEIDITSAVNFTGKNLLELTVGNKPPRASPAGRVMKNYGGLFREVHLESRAEAHIARVQVRGTNTGVTPAAVAVRFALELPFDDNYLLTGDLADPDGNIIDRFTHIARPNPATGKKAVEWEARVPAPRLWRRGRPAFYQIHATLMSPDMDTDTAGARFGLRRFAVRRGRFTLNGRPVYLRGVERVDESPGPLGPVALYGDLDRDVLLIRNAGFNAVRTAFGPPHPAFLDMCDAKGILTLDELPLYGLSGHDFDDPALMRRARLMLRALIRRDAHHPSVVLWGLGSDWDTSSRAARRFIRDLSGYAHLLDPSRGVYVVPRAGAVSRMPGPAATALSPGPLDRRGNYMMFTSQLDDLTSHPDARPVLVFGIAAHARPGDNGGAGRAGATQNQLLLLANARLEADLRPDLDGDFIHALADYAPAARRRGAAAGTQLGITSRDRAPKPAYNWLRDYTRRREQSPPAVKRALLTVHPPGLELALLAALMLAAFVIWSGFSSALPMLAAPHLAGHIIEPGAISSGDNTAETENSTRPFAAWNNPAANLLRFGVPALLVSAASGAAASEILLQRILPPSAIAPAYTGQWLYILQDSAPARLLFSLFIQTALLCLTSAISALLLKKEPFLVFELISRCLFPRAFLFLVFFTPALPIPLILLLAAWELWLRASSLQGEFHTPPARAWILAAAVPAAVCAIACAAALFSLHINFETLLRDLAALGYS